MFNPDHIVKIFGVLRANDDISMTLEEGEIYAILGENGAQIHSDENPLATSPPLPATLF
ncbi:MAG: hypothetical protein U0528_13200 [Anaerolineae bacterium]